MWGVRLGTGWGAPEHSLSASLQSPPRPRKGQGKVKQTHPLCSRVAGARASEGDQGVRGSGREGVCVLDVTNVRLMPAPDQQAVCSQMNGSSFNSWLCLH